MVSKKLKKQVDSLINKAKKRTRKIRKTMEKISPIEEIIKPIPEPKRKYTRRSFSGAYVSNQNPNINPHEFYEKKLKPEIEKQVSNILASSGLPVQSQLIAQQKQAIISSDIQNISKKQEEEIKNIQKQEEEIKKIQKFEQESQKLKQFRKELKSQPLEVKNIYTQLLATIEGEEQPITDVNRLQSILEQAKSGEFVSAIESPGTYEIQRRIAVDNNRLTRLRRTQERQILEEERPAMTHGRFEGSTMAFSTRPTQQQQQEASSSFAFLSS